jgi:hypothetical protein
MIILYVLIFVTNFIQAVKSIMVEDYTWAILQLLVVAASILCISNAWIKGWK